MVRLVPDIRGSDPAAAGLLIECRGQTPVALQVGLWARVQTLAKGGCALPALSGRLMCQSMSNLRGLEGSLCCYCDARSCRKGVTGAQPG